MEYRNELRRQLTALVEMIDSMSMNEEGLPLIEKDIILERLRGMYAYVSGCPTTEVVAKAEVEKNDRADAENTIETVAEKTADATTVTPADATTVTPADTSTETPADKTAEEPVAEPIFAPAERVEKVDSVAQPIMDDVKDEGYEKLFEEEPVEEALEPTTDTEATEGTEPSMEDDTEVEEEIKQEVAPELEETIEPEEATAHEPEPNPEPKPAEEPQKEPSEKAVNTELSLFEYLTKSQEGKRPQTIGDKFGQNHAELGDKLTQQATQHKVTDLRTVININDKFSFVGALFHNNMRAYTDFILRLNAIDNRDKAMQYIGEVAQQNNWNMDSIEVKTFNKILDRKF